MTASAPADETPQDATPEPESSGPLPQWLRSLTHLIALGWGTAEVGFLGARPTSFAFIGLVLGLTEGTRVVSLTRRVLRS